jgi:hypothetical protein
MCQKGRELAFGVKMSQHFISFKHKVLDGKSEDGAKKSGAALHDVPEMKGVSV